MTVCCGPSGSGKSSLAIDTLYAEGQRRYVESLSSYARQFLGQLQKPKVEHISGLSPAISIEQKTTSKSPRSTVGTVTEIYDYLRILFARLGQPLLPRAAASRSARRRPTRSSRRSCHLPEGTKLYVMAPVERAGRREVRGALGRAPRARASPGCGSTASRYSLDEPPKLEPPPQAPGRGRRRPRRRPPVDRGRGWPTRSRRPSTWARASCTSPTSDDDATEPNWHVDRYSQHRVLRQLRPQLRGARRRTTSRSTARSAGARSARGWACSTGPTRRSSIPDGRRSLRQGAVAVWPDFDEHPAVRPDDRRAGRGRGDRPRHARSTSSKAGTAGSILHGAGETWFAVPGRRRRPARVLVPVQGALPGDRGGRRGSRSSTGTSSRGWSTTSPARPAWGRGSATTPRPSGSAASRSTRSAAGRSARPWPSSRS